ncbi:MAG: hypothetical protein NZO16_04410, partial [Deltaproteobacteria bacterium]|nr:hypothetical protein [Deltaproteobacteria bacterium]
VYMSKALNFTRYMSDYFPLENIEIRKVKATVSNSNLNLTANPPTIHNLLIENPNFLRSRNFFNRSALLNASRSNSDNPCSASVCLSAQDGPSSPTSCPYQLGSHPEILQRLCRPRNPNDNISYLQCCQWIRDSDQPDDLRQVEDTMFLTHGGGLKFSFPDFIWREYVGPQPISDILQGVALTHELLRTEFRIQGDKFGILPYDSGLGSTRVFIAPVDIIDKKPSQTEFFENELNPEEPIPPSNQTLKKRLESFLNSTLPDLNDSNSNLESKKFYHPDRIKKRYKLGLFPSIEDIGETNTVGAIATAALMLKEYAFTNQIILLIFTDGINTGSCNYEVPVNGKLTWTQIEQCVNSPKIFRTGAGSRTQISELNRQYLNEFMFDLTGKREYLQNLPGDVPQKKRRSHQGILGFLAENGITPIVFIFNGTAGGIPITSNAENQCLYTREALRSAGLPTAFRSSHDAVFSVDVGGSLYLAKRSGGFGNVFSYLLGNLEPYLLSIGGDFIQLLPKCPHSGNGMPIRERILKFCHETLHRLESSGVSRRFSSSPTHFSRDTRFGICGHSIFEIRQNYPHWGQFVNIWNLNTNQLPTCLAFDFSYIWSNVRFGANLMNFGVDLNMPDRIRPDLNQNPPHEELFNLNHMMFFGETQYFGLTWMPHIQISIAGGLRCHPDLDLKTQIRNVLADILRRPQISIVTNYHEITGIQSVPSSAEDSPVSAE